MRPLPNTYKQATVPDLICFLPKSGSSRWHIKCFGSRNYMKSNNHRIFHQPSFPHRTHILMESSSLHFRHDRIDLLQFLFREWRTVYDLDVIQKLRRL